MDRYGYIGIETLLRFCENSKDHAVTPNDFMMMARRKRPRGRWVEKEVVPIRDTGIEEAQVMRCSECKRWLTTPYVYYLTKYDFCPRCGADMRGEAQDDT